MKNIFYILFLSFIYADCEEISNQTDCESSEHCVWDATEGLCEDEHDHDEHGEHDDHDEHDEEAQKEFVAHYSFNCGNIKEIDRISFPYFTTFPNSGELEVQFVSEIGSTSFEVEGDEPFIDLKGKI